MADLSIPRRQLIAYLVTNTINGKQYVGATKRTIAKRWWEHRRTTGAQALRLLSNAISKYGANVFTIEAIASANTVRGLVELERLLIAQYDTLVPKGYNVMSGGYGTFKPSEEAQSRIGSHLRGKPRTAEVKAKISASHVGMFPTDETRAKISASLTGRIPTASAVANMSAAGLARYARERTAGKPPRSPEHCAKLSKARFGKKASDLTRARMSAASLGKKKSPEAAARGGVTRRINPERVLTQTEIMARTGRGSKKGLLKDKSRCASR